MSNLGRYQDITVEAHKYGGPDAWLDTIKKAEYNRGATDMKNKIAAPMLLAGFGFFAVRIISCQKIKKWILNKREEKMLIQKESAQAEKFLKKELEDAAKDTLDDVNSVRVRESIIEKYLYTDETKEDYSKRLKEEYK